MKDQFDHASLLTRRMVGRVDLLYLKFWAKLTLFQQKRQVSIDIRL